MSGLLLIAGVLSAGLSIVALGGGILMLALGVLVSTNEVSHKDYTMSFFVVVGCFYLGLAAFLGLWVPAVCWIFLGPIALTLGFLIAIRASFGDDEEATCGS